MNEKIEHKIQNGTFPIPHDLRTEVHQILKQMKRPKCIKKDIPSVTTYGSFKKFVKNHKREDIIITIGKTLRPL